MPTVTADLGETAALRWVRAYPGSLLPHTVRLTSPTRDQPEAAGRADATGRIVLDLVDGAHVLTWAQRNGQRMASVIYADGFMSAASLIGMDISIPGPPGPTGPTGETGRTGAAGVQGVMGPQGPQGHSGVDGGMGPQGPKGDAGTQGSQGPSGASGSTGAAGSAGAQGTAGTPGPAGAKGDPGATGPAGAAGVPGTAGPAGAKGDPGAPGANGANGTKGDTGAPGPTGSTGLTGAKGDPGTPGNIGPAGTIGLAGAVGPQGASFNLADATIDTVASGVPFRPRPLGPSAVNVMGSLAAVLNLQTAIRVEIAAPAATGTAAPTTGWKTEAQFGLSSSLGLADANTGPVLVPAGYWVRATATNVAILSQLTLTRATWPL